MGSPGAHFGSKLGSTKGLRVFYVLLFGIRFRIHSHSLIFFIYMYVLLSTVICCMNVFYVDYSSLWLMFLCCNIDYK